MTDDVRPAAPPAPAPAADLRRACDPAALPFDSTSEVAPVSGPAGQPRALEALVLAAELRDGGFNVFATGPSGTGRRSSISAWARERAASEPAPPDVVYLPSFDDPLRPGAAELPAGSARDLAAAVERLVDAVGLRFAEAFESEGYRARHRALHEDLDRRRDEILGRLDAQGRARGVALQVTPTGVMMLPIAAGRPLKPDEAANMPAEARAQFEAAVAELREPADTAFAAIHELEREAAAPPPPLGRGGAGGAAGRAPADPACAAIPPRVRVAAAPHAELVRDVAGGAIRPLADEVRARWADAPGIVTWLDRAADDMVANVVLFQGTEGAAPAPPAAGATPAEALRARYAVNVLVTNDPDGGAPVLVPTDPTFSDLFGRVEYETALGAVVTDHRHLRAGAVHAARGGYLLLDAAELLAAPFAWARLKDVLRTGRLKIENPAAQYTVFPGVSPDAEPIEVRMTVVLVGTRELYELLYAVDDDVARLFKLRADFDVRMERDEAGVRAIAAILRQVSDAHDLPPFDRGAVARLVEHSSRLAGDQRRLSLRLRPLCDVAVEAGLEARRAGRERVGAQDVANALAARRRRSNLPEIRLREATLERVLRVEVEGASTGQVNGLAVSAAGDHEFGHPVRISATVSAGDGQVLDIDREAELSGRLHSKGVLIVSGFLAGRYAGDGALSLRASIVFEQSYGPVEGDSASAAELFAVLSALAGVPLRQGVAVTGSVDQHGAIQAIGGINEKIEGFFALCRDRGLTGDQGVVVPEANLVHTMLDPEVVDAVAAQRFHVWPIRTVDEGLAVLSACSAEEIDERVRARLAAFREAARAARAPVAPTPPPA